MRPKALYELLVNRVVRQHHYVILTNYLHKNDNVCTKTILLLPLCFKIYKNFSSVYYTIIQSINFSPPPPSQSTAQLSAQLVGVYYI